MIIILSLIIYLLRKPKNIIPTQIAHKAHQFGPIAVPSSTRKLKRSSAAKGNFQHEGRIF